MIHLLSSLGRPPIRLGPAVRYGRPPEVHRPRCRWLRVDITRAVLRNLVHRALVPVVRVRYEVDRLLSMFAFDLIEEGIVVEPPSAAAAETA